ncbi:CBS domain-containing protein [Psychromonas sp. MME1]|uniref:CBS domain-containing protein n=1 Tax=Psychromonas sp. MME1 TaxID=3231032 RepID=UPI0034E1BB71
MMTTRVVTVDMDDRLTVVKEILDHGVFHHLLVVEDNQLQGIISEHDLLRCLSPFLGTDAESTRDTATINQRAHQIMTRSPLVIAPQCTVSDALMIMLNNNIGCLPVLEGGEIKGIFTWRDGVRALLENR